MPPPRPRNLAAAEQRRDRVYHALGQMRLVSASVRDGPANGGSRPDTSACEHYLTPLASPAGSPRQRLRPGEAAPTQAEEATPGFTPPPSPPSPPAPHAPPRWQDARPPSAQPGDRNSWLLVPLLHTAAGNLSEQALAAWRSLPDDAAGRFDALADALQAAPPAEPSCLARLLHSVAECDAEEAGEAPPGIPATDAALATSLRALPAAPIPLATALLLAQAPDGYVSAAAQSAFLEAYGGVPLATAARALADDLRAAMSHRPRHGPRARRRRRRAGRARADGSAGRVLERPPGPADSDSAQTDVPECPPPATAGPRGWEQLDAIDLADELRRPVPTMQDVPPFLRAAVRSALVHALTELRMAGTLNLAESEAAARASRAWKLFLLVPRMLLTRAAQQGSQGRAELLERAAAFQRGEWTQLIRAAQPSHRAPARQPPPPDAATSRKRNQACAKVRQGELSRARQVLTAAELAPGTDATWQALTDPARRPPQPLEPLPAELLAFQPDQQVRLAAGAVATTLREAKRGGAAGLSGMRAEHLKILLQDAEAIELLADAATQLARAHVPQEIQQALAMARMTALRKPDGGVRGIATGDAFRRLVARTLAKQWADVFDNATRPYQFALQARAGTDALAAHVRVAIAQRRDAVLVSLDGRSAYDCMSRLAFLSKLRDVAPELLPFVRMFYGQPSVYSWWDDSGRLREIQQGEGCEQGDALAPALFALGQHEALDRAASSLHPDDTLLAFLDDLYIVTTPARAREAFDTAAHAVEDHCGIASNLGKTRVLAAEGGPPPPGITELGEDVWCGDKPPAQRGVVVLGTPVGHPDFVQAWTDKRLCEERRLLEELPHLPDLQCAWLLLLFCASPRANHALRTLPPSEAAPYARGHDQAVWEALQQCLGGVAQTDAAHAWSLASLPAIYGGLGLQSAERTAPAAYWAAWMDALPVIRARLPQSADRCLEALEQGNTGGQASCLREAASARNLLLAEGWDSCPTWRTAYDGTRPPHPTDAGPGDWPHGWQHHATRTRNLYYRDRVLLPSLQPASRALLRSQSGPHGGAWLAAVPSEPALTLAPQTMQLALRRRLRLPLPLCPNRCGPRPGCGQRVDAYGDHALACPRTGLLARRAKIVERAWVRVAREAVGPDGQVVPQQWLALTTAPGVPSDDRRRLDLVVYGAAPRGGAMCCDATLVSPLTRAGQPHTGTADTDGAALRVAERRKHSAYPELSQGGPQQLVVLGSEVGGRWNTEAQRFLRDLLRVRAQRAPPALRPAARAGWTRRWWGLLSVAVQQAVATTALGRAWPAPLHPHQRDAPPLERVLELAAPAGPSRLPLRA